MAAVENFRRLWGAAGAVIVAALSTGCGGEPEGDYWSRWTSYGGTPDSAQYSSLDEIRRDNVQLLEEVWRFPSGTESHRSTPIVIGGVMYLVANGGVTALDAATGRQIWHAPDTAAPEVRGLSFWADGEGVDRRLFVVREHFLNALDADTGEPLAAFGDGGRIDLRKDLNRDPETITRVATMTPGRVFENLIIVGSAVGDRTYTGAPGDIRAYDVRSGKLVWTFHTIPHPGEFGYDTWPPDAWQTIGAANAWTSLSVDEDRGIVFVPTGAPSYHFYGANRAGDNLFANSLIALDARTGKRLWHFQAVHHDIWDYDIAMAPKLLTLERNGSKVDAVALATKQGFLFVFDRETGDPVFPIEERPVPPSDVPGEQAAATQPFPVDLPPFARQTLSAEELSPHADPSDREALAARIRVARNEGIFTPPSFRGTVSAPGSRGGAQHGNGAVVPDRGLFFLAVVESPTIPLLEVWQELDAASLASSPAAGIYAEVCAPCHGAAGEGRAPLFPALAGAGGRLSPAEFISVVRRGRGRMSAFPEIAEAQAMALWEYADALPGTGGTPEPVVEDIARDERLMDADRYRSGYHHFFSDEGLLGPLPWSRLVAYDLNEGKILWDVPFGDVLELAERGITGTGSLFPTNSLTATAGGLLFSTTNDRKLRAWDQDSGEVLWETALPADPGGMPAVYEVEGRQFVVAAATRDRPGSIRRGEHAYIAYALKGVDQ